MVISTYCQTEYRKRGRCTYCLSSITKLKLLQPLRNEQSNFGTNAHST